jgi:hypothetical protein
VTLPFLLIQMGQIGMAVTLSPEGKLRWTSREQPSPDLLRSLAANKDKLIALIRLEKEQADRQAIPLTTADQFDAWREAWEERVGLMMADGDLPKEQAEQMALVDMAKRVGRGEHFAAKCGCRACGGSGL